MSRCSNTSLSKEKNTACMNDHVCGCRGLCPEFKQRLGCSATTWKTRLPSNNLEQLREAESAAGNLAEGGGAGEGGEGEGAAQNNPAALPEVWNQAQASE